MDRLRNVWGNIRQLEKKQRTIVVIFLVAIVTTWLAVCVLLLSALSG